jgi:hypothetical protein
MTTLSGAVDGCAPTGAGPSGRARCRKESFSAMLEMSIFREVRVWEAEWVGGEMVSV